MMSTSSVRVDVRTLLPLVGWLAGWLSPPTVAGRVSIEHEACLVLIVLHSNRYLACLYAVRLRVLQHVHSGRQCVQHPHQRSPFRRQVRTRHRSRRASSTCTVRVLGMEMYRLQWLLRPSPSTNQRHRCHSNPTCAPESACVPSVAAAAIPSTVAPSALTGTSGRSPRSTPRAQH